jgi:hypothetical protein
MSLLTSYQRSKERFQPPFSRCAEDAIEVFRAPVQNLVHSSQCSRGFCAGLGGPVVHCPGLLLHCRDGRLAGPEDHPAVWVLLHDALHAHPGRGLPEHQQKQRWAGRRRRGGQPWIGEAVKGVKPEAQNLSKRLVQMDCQPLYRPMDEIIEPENICES